MTATVFKVHSMTSSGYSDGQLIAQLELPVRIVSRAIENTGCPYSGKHRPAEQHCWKCRLNRECRWLDRAGRAMLSVQTDVLETSLLYAASLVYRQLNEEKHHMDSCLCDRCSWLRSVRQHQDGIVQRHSDST